MDCMFSFSALTFALWQAGRNPWTQDQLQDPERVPEAQGVFLELLYRMRSCF